MNNNQGSDRAEYLLDIIEQLAGYRGTLRGTVVNNMYNTNIDSAHVSLPGGTLSAVTGDNGRFEITRIPTEQFTLTVQRRGYTEINAAEYSFDGEREMEIQFRMMHPELNIDPVEIGEEVEENTQANLETAITNTGDGPLEYDARLRTVQVVGYAWDEISSFDAGANLEDTRLQAAIYLDGFFWIAGGNSGADAINQMYKVDLEGNVVDQWDQISESNYGWRDLTTDGEYIYGVDAQEIVQIDPATGRETDVRIASEYMPNPMYSITYEPERDLFWVSGPTTDILAFDRNGRFTSRINNDRRFRISGLSWFEEDPDGYKIYVTSQNDQRYPEMVKVNHLNGDHLWVCSMVNPEDEDEKPGGGEMTSELFPFTTVLVCQMQGREDWMRTFEAGTDFYWLDVSPLQGQLDPEASQSMTLEFDASGIEPGTTYEAFVQFDHNTPETEVIWVNISMTVTEASSVDDTDLTPHSFEIASIYPNPFNPTATVEFTLDKTADINISVFDLSGRLMANVINDTYSAGQHSVTLDGAGWSSGIYLVKLTDGAREIQRKITLVR